MSCQKCIHRSVCRKTPLDSTISCADYADITMYPPLPCPLGSPVYVITNCYCYSEAYANRCRNRTHGNRKSIAVYPAPPRMTSSGYKQSCIKIHRKPFKLEYLTKLGKTVFVDEPTLQKAINKITNKENKQ